MSIDYGYFADEWRFVRRARTARTRLDLLKMAIREHAKAKRFDRFLPLGREFESHVHLDGGPEVRLRSNDFGVFFEIFGLDSYGLDLSPLRDVRTILDLGANIGLAAVYFAQKYPGARVACVEPSPESFALLEENLRRNAPRATAVRAAVAAKPGSVEVVAGASPGMTRVVDAASATSATVEARTIPQLLDDAGMDVADFVKMDIEGGEAALFATAGEWSGRVKAILAEIHEPLTRRDAEQQLAEHGFQPLPIPDRRLFESLIFVERSG